MWNARRGNPCKVYCVVNPNPENIHNTDAIEAACEEFEKQWEGGGQPRIEDFLEQISEDLRERVLRELVETDCWWRKKQGEEAVADDYCERFPEHSGLIQDAFDARAARATASMQGEETPRRQPPQEARNRRSIGAQAAGSPAP